MIRRPFGLSILAVSALLFAFGTGQGSAGWHETPPRSDLSAEMLLPPTTFFQMHDGYKLPARVWAAEGGDKRGVILALHGFTDSRDAWEYPAPGFAAAGYTVVAPDQRGFGGTVSRGVWAGQRTLVDDAAELVAQLRVRYPGQRLILMGESMGGAVAMCLAARNPTAADEIVLLSPAVWGRGQMAMPLQAALWAAFTIAPNWRFSGNEVPQDITASDNRDAITRLAHDPLTLRSVSVSMLHGLVGLMDAAQEAAAKLPPHTLILDGRRDQVIPPPATAAAWERLPHAVRRGFYLSGYHLLLRDQDRALVEADILAWLDAPDQWLPSGADVNAAAWVADHGWTHGLSDLMPAATLDGTGLRRVWPF